MTALGRPVTAAPTAATTRPLRLAWLCKRRYMRHDVIDDRYGRLYELPAELARRGHRVLGLCLDYHGRGASQHHVHDAAPGTLEWRAWPLGRAVVPGLLAYLRGADEALATFRPDVVLASSDCLHAVFARRAAVAARCPYGVDLYDNYASFGLARLPGLPWAYHRALRNAGLVSCVSRTLEAHVREHHAPAGATLTLESTIGVGLFGPRAREACRDSLGLPRGLHLVGTAGALDQGRDIATLYGAYRRLRAARNDVGLVLAGAGDQPVPDLPGVFHLGMLPHARVAELFAALDVAVICLADTEFGRYAFPQKAYEIVACGTPLVGARVGALGTLLAPWPHSLYTPGDEAGLATALAAQLDTPRSLPLVAPTWADQAARLEAALRTVLTPGSGASQRD